MLKHFIFDIGQQVRITELQWNGIVISIFISEIGIQYNVRYFWNGEAKTVYFFEHELKSTEKNINLKG